MWRLPPSKRWPPAPSGWPCLISTCTTATAPRQYSSTTPSCRSSPSTNSPAIPAPARGTSATIASTTRCRRKRRAANTATVLASALEHLQTFKPGLVAVSAGFDAYARDPLAQGSLEAEDFYWLGQSLRNLGVPLFSLLEGGYSADLPDLILAYLKGVEGK